MPAETLAILLDKHYINSEKKSYYDSPFKAWTPGGGVLLEDRAKSDSLRNEIRLPSLPDSAFVEL